MSSSNSNDLRLQLRELGRRRYQQHYGAAAAVNGTPQSIFPPSVPPPPPLLPLSTPIPTPAVVQSDLCDKRASNSSTPASAPVSSPMHCDEPTEDLEPDLDSFISISTRVVSDPDVSSPTAVSLTTASSGSTKALSADEITSPLGLREQEKTDQTLSAALILPAAVLSSSSSCTTTTNANAVGSASSSTPSSEQDGDPRRAFGHEPPHVSTGLCDKTTSPAARPNNSRINAVSSNTSALLNDLVQSASGNSSNSVQQSAAVTPSPLAAPAPSMSASLAAAASPDGAEWFTCACPDSTCNRPLFFQKNSNVPLVHCSGCLRAHPLFRLLFCARHATGPRAAADDRQAFVLWLTSTLLSTIKTASVGPDIDEPEVLARLMKRQAEMGPRELQCVAVRGLCGFHCKLISPLLTYYGIDRSDGNKPAPLTQLYRKRRARRTSGSEDGASAAAGASGAEAEADASRASNRSVSADTFDCSKFKDYAYRLSYADLYTTGFGMDHTGSFDYLRDVLRIIKRHPANGSSANLVPLYTSGDGHCLVHAVSRALVGRELFWHPLQFGLRRHLEQNIERYKRLFGEFITEEAEWKQIVEECDPAYVPPASASKDRDRCPEMQGLGAVHIQGLANLLRRPIILLDAPEGIASFGYYSCVYLPLLYAPEDCLAAPDKTNAQSPSPAAGPNPVSTSSSASASNCVKPVASDESLNCCATSSSSTTDQTRTSTNSSTSTSRSSAERTLHSKPICIAWNNRAHYHFVPLVSIREKPVAHIPRLLLQKAFLVSVEEIAKYVDIIPCGCVCHQQLQLQLSASRDSHSPPPTAAAPTLVSVPLQQRTDLLARAGAGSGSETSVAPAPAPTTATTAQLQSAGAEVEVEVEDTSRGTPARRCDCMHFQSTSTTDSDDPGAQQQPVAAAECAWASCEIGGTLSVSDSYIDALVKGMNEVFTQQRGISPQAVVEYFRNCRDFSNDPLVLQVPLKPDDVISRAKETLRHAARVVGTSSAKRAYPLSEPNQSSGASSAPLAKSLMNLRTTAYKNQLTEDDLLQVLHSAIKVEQFPEESRELRQHLFAAAFQYHRDDPMYKQPVYFGLSPKNCASVLRGLIVFYPSILFGPRCTSLDDYFSGSDGALERAALKHQYVRDDKDGLIAAIIHSELYHFLHERFLSVYGAEEMEDGTHIETNLEILSLYFNLVYDRARDAFDLCNAMTGHLPAGSNAQLYISNFLDGQLKNGFPFPAFCDQSHNSLPLYTNSPPSLDLTDESEFHPHLPLPTAARQSSSSSLPLLLLNALSSLAKEKQQEHIATSGSMSPRNTRSTSSDLLAQLPEAVTDEIGDKDDGGRGAQPPPLFAHQSRELAEAIQRAASAAQLPTREPMDLSMALAPSNGESMALAPSNSDSAAVGEELPLAYTDSAVAGAGTSSSAEPRSLHESAQHSPK